MNIKKIYTENGKVIKEYFVHKEDAKDVASKLGIADDLVEKLEEMLATDEFIVVENENGFSLSKDGKMVSFNVIAGYLNSEDINGKNTVSGTISTETIDISQIDCSKSGKVKENGSDIDESLD